jgi:hypothetical protein
MFLRNLIVKSKRPYDVQETSFVLIVNTFKIEDVQVFQLFWILPKAKMTPSINFGTTSTFRPTVTFY